MKELVTLAARVAHLEHRFANTARHGTVEEVDTEKQRLRLRLGEDDQGKPFIGPWIPYAQMAGALKVHAPPSVGQQYTLFAPTGDWQQAVAVPFTWSDQNPSPSQKQDENVITYGNAKIELRDGQLKMTVGDAVLDIASGKITMTVGGAGYELDGSELKMTTTFRGKGGSKPAHYVTGKDTAGDAAVDGNPDVLV